MKILDCTLRDGGYYTNWDFDKNLVDDYLESLNHLPIDYIEIGYRSFPQKEYLGEYFYCPKYLIQRAKKISQKKLVVMLNEKDVRANQVEKLLHPAIGNIDLIRLAVDPQNIIRAIDLALAIKKIGFEVGFNIMYMSTWKSQPDFLDNIKYLNGVIDYFYMVDSFGGVYPDDIVEICNLVKDRINIPFGFHGHNNMELALINSLTAIENGAELLDATITGMGRGAGNLKTELLLTALDAKGKLDFDYNYLSKIVDSFSKLQEEYQWGTNLPYMVSGANSLPQKDVMEWVGKRYYSFNSIIRALSNQSKGIKDNIKLLDFMPQNQNNRALIVGGGPSGTKHTIALNAFLESNDDISIIHTSSKNVASFENLKNTQIHCLSGNEGHRLESTFINSNNSNRIAILPPFPRIMGTYIPSFFKDNAFQLPDITFSEIYKESVTAIAIQTAINLGAQEILFVGYDGYNGNITVNEIELFDENQTLFSKLKDTGLSFYSLTPTRYQQLTVNSIYSLL